VGVCPYFGTLVATVIVASDFPVAQVAETHPKGVMKAAGPEESLALVPMRGSGRQ
jgi:hypothetical protein